MTCLCYATTLFFKELASEDFKDLEKDSFFNSMNKFIRFSFKISFHHFNGSSKKIAFNWNSKISNGFFSNLRLEQRLRGRHRRLQVADPLQDGRRELRDVGVVSETLDVDAVLVDFTASVLHRIIQSLEVLVIFLSLVGIGAQLVDRLLPAPEVLGLNPDISKNFTNFVSHILL